MTKERRAELLARIDALDADTIGTLFVLPDPPRDWFKGGHAKAFTRVSGNAAEAIRIARELLQ